MAEPHTLLKSFWVSTTQEVLKQARWVSPWETEKRTGDENVISTTNPLHRHFPFQINLSKKKKKKSWGRGLYTHSFLNFTLSEEENVKEMIVEVVADLTKIVWGDTLTTELSGE